MPLDVVQIELGDRSIGLRRLGSGPPLLCLHGFPQTSACWEPLAARLADRFTVLMPDLPGFGASDPASSADARTVADTMVELLDALGLDRVTVVGHDFGGAIAWSLGIAHPDRLDGLVVVNSPLRRLDLRHGWHMLALNLPIVPEALFTVAGGTIVEAMIKRCLVRKDAIDAEAMQEYRRAFRTIEAQRNAFAYYRTVTRAYLKHAFRRRIPSFVPFIGRPEASTQREQRKIEVPTMVVWGAADPVLPVHLTDDLARHIADLRLELLDGIGHFVPEEAPDELASLIASFAT
jgi:pimeloyl-ACP methyl ester carboxylesterase